MPLSRLPHRHRPAARIAGFLAGAIGAAWALHRICESAVVTSHDPFRLELAAVTLPEAALTLMAFFFALKLISVALVSARD